MNLRNFLKSSLMCEANTQVTFRRPPLGIHVGESPESAWTYRLLFSGKRPEVQNLAYDVPEMGTMTVAESIAWGEVSVTAPGIAGNQAVSLPLTEKFLQAHAHVKSGTVPANNTRPFWRTSTTVSLASLLVFAYRIGDGKPQPLPPNGLDPWLETRLSPPPRQPSIVDSIGANRYVFVCVELVLCKAENNFEPFGIANVARLYPLTHVFCTFPTTSVKSAVTVRRPHQSGMHHHGSGAHGGSLVNAIFADRNAASIGVTDGFPGWNKLFDCYAYDPTGEYQIVGQSGARSSNAIRQAWSLTFNGLSGSYAPTTVSKLARQGAFDNIHIAPQLHFRPPALNPRTYVYSMAPICHHDCLHTHWRWSSGYSADWVKGWTSDGPNMVAGAPMVPLNQTVSMKLDAATAGFTYTGTASDVAANQWSVFFHHGSGYVDSFAVPAPLKWFAELGPVNALTDLAFPDDVDPWAKLYFNFAYAPTSRASGGITPVSFTPRIRADLDSFAAL